MFISIPVILPQVSLGFLVYLNPKYKFLSLMPLMLVNLSANKKLTLMLINQNHKSNNMHMMVIFSKYLLCYSIKT